MLLGSVEYPYLCLSELNSKSAILLFNPIPFYIQAYSMSNLFISTKISAHHTFYMVVIRSP